jgi:DNA-binding CsgD family transcriptional regulator
MDLRDRLLHVIDGIYGAAGTPARWTPCLKDVADLLGGTVANLLHHDHRDHRGGLSASTVDPAGLDAYVRHFHALDPWAGSVRPGTFTVGQTLLGRHLVAPDAFRRTAFYADFGRHFETTRVVVGVIEMPAMGASASITINRSDRGEEFDEASARLLGVLVPHLRRALALHRHLAAANAERAVLLDVLDRIRTAIVIVDAALRVVIMNRAASRLAGRRHGLVVDGRHLRGATADATTALTAALASAVAVAQGRTLAAGRLHVRLPTPPDGRALEAQVLPLPSDDGQTDVPAAAVFIVDPDEPPATPDVYLAERFRLTPLETRVAQALARGQSAAAIADSLRLTQETTRWYVKQVLAKTDTPRQSELVRLLSVLARLEPGE